jgi:glycosyltransferase involved in cell wall biosynthesis
MLRDASIICLSSIDWDFNRQNPQEAASAFAVNGHRVLFIENTGARRVGWRDARRLIARLTNWWRTGGNPARRERNIDVLSPVLLPFPYSRAATSLNARVLTATIRRWIARGNSGPLIVVTFLPTPLALDVIRALDATLVVYFCIDRLAESSPGARQIARTEQQLFADADLVLVTAASLYDMAAPVASRVEIVPSGVSIEAYDEARRSTQAPPAVFDGISGRVIGFVGSIRQSTDVALLGEAAALAPDLTFVVAGPQQTDVSSLAQLGNVRMTGAIPYTDVATYIARFDAGILPYVLDRFSSAIMPVKLKEYLAAGLPVISTSLPEVVAFAEQHPGTVEFANDAPSFVSAIRSGIAQNTAEAAARRVEVAREFEWSRQMQRMIDIVEEILDEGRAAGKALADGAA